MAKNEVLKALATLKESGIKLTKDQTTALEEFQTQAMRDAAETILNNKLNDSENRGQWAREMFDFAERLSTAVKPVTGNRGRGVMVSRMFRVETPHGSLKVELSEPADD